MAYQQCHTHIYHPYICSYIIYIYTFKIEGGGGGGWNNIDEMEPSDENPNGMTLIKGGVGGRGCNSDGLNYGNGGFGGGGGGCLYGGGGGGYIGLSEIDMTSDV